MQSYLNTSYVDIKLSATSSKNIPANDLNTSYVDIKLCFLQNKKSIHLNLNTSYVDIKRSSFTDFQIQIGFKYILC